MYTPAQIPLKTVKMVESEVPGRAGWRWAGRGSMHDSSLTRTGWLEVGGAGQLAAAVALGPTLPAWTALSACTMCEEHNV